MSTIGINADRAFYAVAAVGAGTAGGIFLAFSALTMPGLDRLAASDPRAAVTAMQAMNEVALRPPFMAVFFGTSLLALGAGVLGVARRTPAGWLAVAGGAVVVLGVLALTAGRNVPLNEALAAVGPGDDAARAWAAFAPGWIAANHVRGVCGVGGAALLAAAALRR